MLRLMRQKEPVPCPDGPQDAKTGAQSFGYALFFLSESALEYLPGSKG
jgi:hypothetical protein